MQDEKQKLTFERAVELLNDGEEIHVFLNPNGMLVGADWSRKEILKLLKDAESIEVGGPSCINLKHGLVAWHGNRPHFIESRAGL
jgi:hypothetical protein